MKTVLITGSTSGIGLATAQKLAHEGDFKLIVCGRRKERLTKLTNQLKSNVKITSLNFDVRDKKAVMKSLESLPNEFKAIDVLINNAGNAHGLDYIQDGSLEDWDAMIDINVKGLLYVSKPIIKSMLKKQSGHIINIGSTAGKEVYPKGNVYCASKHAVDALNQAMRIDLNKHGIRVGAINPGLVETEFSEVRFKGDRQRASSVYEGYQALKPEDIADIVYFCITRPYHVNIADLVVFPSAQASSTIINKHLK
ncbi:MAG: SDR family NAD(P)-dependent oxidoreductase [Psychroflexus sp.]|nr:SDR family NAD(P)-dependent oxidoreductase [Psychroflexus sp.]